MSMPKVLRDLKYLRESQLTGKYHIPETRVISVESVPISTNPIPTSWTSINSTVYTSGDYMIESNVPPISPNNLDRAFNMIATSSSMYACNLDANSRLTIYLTLPSAIKVSKFKTYIPATTIINTIEIQGSIDKSKWTTLHTSTVGDNSLTEKVLNNDNSFRFYRFVIANNNAGPIDIYDIQISEYTIVTKESRFILEDIPNPLSENQRIFLKTGSFDNTGISKSLFNDVDIDTVLLPNRYYELIYNSNRYLAKEVV